MKLTIITINRDNAPGLQRTMLSVARQSARAELEYIVVDGASTDGSAELLAASGADRWVSEPDRGVYHAMNKGVAMARGEYCLFLNSADTLAADDVIARALPALDGLTDVVCGYQWVVTPEGRRKRFVDYTPERMTMTHLVHGTLPHQSAFIRRERLVQQPYSEEFGLVADWYFFADLFLNRQGSYRRLPFCVSVYGLDGLSSRQPERVMQERQEGLRRLLPEFALADLRAVHPRDMQFYHCYAHHDLVRLLLRGVRHGYEALLRLLPRRLMERPHLLRHD